MNSIGGYFELDLPFFKRGEELKNYNYNLNSGRNSLLVLLQSKNFKKVYLPRFTCKVIIDVLEDNEILYSFYSINAKLEAEALSLKKDEVLLYTNYFGLMDSYIKKLSLQYQNIIIDNAQAFYSRPINSLDSIYSPRKFFGIPDGGGLFTNTPIDLEQYPIDQSHQRFSHLIKRIDLGAEEGYSDFIKNDGSLDNEPIKKMSKLTRTLLRNLDFNEIKERRLSNFNYLDKRLNKRNLFKIDLDNDFVPLIYPFLVKNGDLLRKKLIENRIFVAKYWPDVIERVEKDSIEYNLVQNLIALPIDQRYDDKDMDRIMNVIIAHDEE